MTVAIPVRNGGPLLEGVLEALARQTVAHELLVCDSGSTDDSGELARAHGARLLSISPEEFGHGRTRNLLMREARGTHVALLSQDAEPADERWLERLLESFSLAGDVGLACGSYLPRADAPASVRIELEAWFASLAPDGLPHLERLSVEERGGGLPAVALVGRRGFFTDANACVARAAWEHVPFRDVAYAEDRALALDMLRAGYAKAYVPAAGVLHSHRYTTLEELRRGFDEWRGLQEIYGWREPTSPAHLASRVRGALGRARRDPALAALATPRRVATLAAVARQNVARMLGALLGSRADSLPRAFARALSLEGSVPPARGHAERAPTKRPDSAP
ncbi:MAG TPA: glycosyltransferase family 2 protein [Solirubrobacteraceae bacterium]|nr:glycosyltransferase family 2 protein [Solirubrobacteraceae bacterium]